MKPCGEGNTSSEQGSLKEQCDTTLGRWLHPCFINQKHVLVHCPSLPARYPSFFEQLVAFAKARSVVLLADRRWAARPVVWCGRKVWCRRKAWLPVVTLCFAFGAPVAKAEQEVRLGVVSSAEAAVKNRAPSRAEYRGNSEPLGFVNDKRVAVAANPYWQNKIATLLLSRYEPKRGEPADIAEVLQKMAGYYSRYPAVHALFDDISTHPWSLSFAAGTFDTSVQRTRFEVRDVKVQFDPHSGAQLKFNALCAKKMDFCYASPADVLLHELLHVKAIWAGGLAAVGKIDAMVYPYQHEYQTIEAEKQLYSLMRAVDRKPRPMRSDHVGKTVTVACITCVK